MKELTEISNLNNAETMLRVLEFAVKKALSDPETLYSILPISNQVKTFGSLCEDYKKYLNEFEFSSKYQYSVKTTLNKAAFLFGPEKKIHEINSKLIEEYIQFCKRKAPAGYKVDYRNLKAFFAKVVNWGYIKENPCKFVKLPKEQSNRREYLTYSELQSILTLIRLQVLKDIYSFAFQTALRLSEILNLRWSDVSLNDGTITIGSKNFQTKTKKIRCIPLSNDALEILKKRFPKIIDPVNDFVFTKKDGKKYSNDFVSKSFKKALRQAGLKGNICFHSLRHSAISHALNSGAPLSAVREFAGHSNIQTTQNYLHTNMDDLKKVSQTFNIAVGDK